LAFLLASGDDIRLRLYKAGGVVVGYLSHLLLDELYSVEWRYGLLRLKRSFGTAVKIWGDKWLPNIVTFTLLGVLGFVAVQERAWMRRHYEQHIQHTADQAAQQVERTALRAGQLLDEWTR